MFAVPFGGGTMHLVVCNLPGDCGIDRWLDATATELITRLADEDDGHQAEPGLPWSMLPSQPAHLLLSLPVMGGPDEPAGMVRLVAKALRGVGAITLVNELARQLLQNRACVTLQ